MSHNELDTIIEKLDKIIELLAPKDIVINSPISVTSSNEQAAHINEALMNLAQKLDSENKIAINNKIDKRPIVIERNEEGKRLREGRLYNDGSVEWQRVYS